MENQFFNIENKAGVASLRITGRIGSWSASSEYITARVDELINEGVTNLDAYINSIGGSTFEATEIGNQLRRFTGTKTVQVGSLAASAGCYLLAEFDTVKAYSNSQAMIHDLIMRPEIKSIKDFDSLKTLYQNTRNIIIDALTKKMKVKRSEVENMMGTTTWIDAKRGKELGLFDEIVEGSDNKLPDNPKNLMELYDSLPTNLVNQIQNKTENNNDMKEILKALGLPENTSEADAVKLIGNLKANAVKGLTALAVSKGMKAEQIAKLANADFDTTLEMVTDKAVTIRAAEQKSDKKEEETAGDEGKSNPTNEVNFAEVIANALKGGKVEEKKKTEDDYTPEELEALCENDPKAYDKLKGL